MFPHNRQSGAPAHVNGQQNPQHPAHIHPNWYQAAAYHHQTAFGDESTTGWHHPPIPGHLYSPPGDIADFLQSNVMHGMNYNMGGPHHQSYGMVPQTIAPRTPNMDFHLHGQEVVQIPSPLSGSSGLSSPGGNASSPTENGMQNGQHVNRPTPARSPYEWIKKNAYQHQPNPGKTRTKDKYRVVYTDHQRVELEKEFYFSRYITIRKKSELAVSLGLSERQVKIWFQNRRAKERKQNKKRQEMTVPMKGEQSLPSCREQPLMLANTTHPPNLPIM